MPEIINVPLHVELVGQTTSHFDSIASIYEAGGGTIRTRDQEDNGKPLMEIAGRGCYESYKRTNEKTDSHEGYLGNIVNQHHLSVIEHDFRSFYIEGISRAESHEMVRHRHFSFSQQSQRYVTAKKPYRVAIHPTLMKEYGEREVTSWLVPQFELAESTYNNLRDLGMDKKPASEAARAFLPNAAETHMVMTGNLRSWLEFISKRDHEAADAGIRRVAQEIHAILKEDLPEIFSDEARAIWDEEFAQGKARV